MLWDEPPDSAVKTVRSHLSRLRALLATAGFDRAITRAGATGYRLELPSGTTDVDVVAECRQRAAQLAADGRPDAGASLLADARRLWGGDPELPATTGALALVRCARRQRRQVVYEQLRCVVEGTEPGAAIAELEELTTIEPTDEPMWVLYVEALHRSGHQVEAVPRLSTARAALAEVGLVPGAPLAGVEREVFAGSFDVVAGEGSAPTAGEPAIAYADDDGHRVAYTVLASGPARGRSRDVVVLNPAMITIDGLLDEPHARGVRSARLGEHARVVGLDRSGIGLSDPLADEHSALDRWTADVVAVLDDLGIDDAAVLASFDTGLVAIELAARHPERVASLVLAHCFATYSRHDDYPHGPDPSATPRADP